MKKKYVLLSLLLGLAVYTSAQTNLEQILRSSNNFATLVERANDYFATQYPGLAPNDLVSGELRDGEYVKFRRWQAFWADRLDKAGNLGDPSAYFRNQRNEGEGGRNNPYTNVAWTEVNYTDYIIGQIGLGRTTSIGFHPTNPNTWYVGAAIGGIWRTTNNGQSYTPLGDDLPFLAVSSIIVDQDNPNTLYIALSDHVWYGPPGIGVYKSTNGGSSWQATDLSFAFTQDRRIYWMEADPQDSDHILVATAGGLYRTTNGFTTSNQVLATSCYQVRFHESTPGTIYLGDRNGRFYRSTDGGLSFTQLHDFGNGDVHIDVGHTNPNIVYVRVGNKMYRSTDSGSNFAEQGTLQENGEAFKVALTDDDIIVSGNFNVARSDNAGSNFTQITDWLGAGGLPSIHVDQRNIFVNPLQPDYVYLCNDGGVYRYQVSTGNFENLCNGLKITQYYDIAVAQTDANVIGGGSQDNGNVYRTSSGVWQQYASTGDGMNQAINQENANIRYWSYQLGGIRRWQSGSNTNIAPNGEGGDGAWETPYRLDPSDPQRIIIGYQEVYESVNGGTTWTAISGDLAGGSNLQELAIAPSNGERIYVVQGSNLFVKSLTDNSWTTKSLPSGSISDIEVDFQDEDQLYISVSGYSSGNKVWMSADAGDNWTNLSGSLPNVSTGAIELLNGTSGGIFVGNDNGVYYRDDDNPAWCIYGNLPNTRVEDIEIQYEAELIRVGTHGRGILEAPVVVDRCEEGDPDSDNDGICDLADICPNLNNNQLGQACDDDDEFSQGEVYANDCNCADGAAFETYCTAAGSAGTGSDWINRVELNDLNHSSGKSAYSDFREQTTRLDHGAAYTLHIELNYVFPPDRALAWIDFDRSGTFDVDEGIAMNTQAVNDVFSGNFIVPLDAVSGAVTMRVRNVYSTTVNTPCGNVFGEVEDYTVRLMCTAGSTNGQCGLVVPLEWLRFTAFPLQTGAAELNWATSKEEGVSHFIVERSYDGRSFESAGRVEAQNTVENEYRFVDQSVNRNLAYYRIRSVDFDESTSSTELRLIRWDHNSNNTLAVYPNPTDGPLIFSTQPDKARVLKWQVFDLRGRVMLRGVRSIADGQTKATIQVNPLPAGHYLLQVEDGSTRQAVKLIKY